MRHGIWEYTVPKGVTRIEVKWSCEMPTASFTLLNHFIWSYSGNASGSWNLKQGTSSGLLPYKLTWYGYQVLENVNGGEKLKIEAKYSKKYWDEFEIWCECEVSFYY